MSSNPELDAMQREATRQRILEAGFRLFAARTIGKVAMTDVAEAAGLGVATVYRHFSTKTALAAEISAWVWETYMARASVQSAGKTATAAQKYEFFLDSFFDLYRSRRDLLRYNQFFNVYIQSEEDVSEESLAPFRRVVAELQQRFDAVYEQAKTDGTLRTDLPSAEIFLPSLHLMLAAVTRYAVGLLYVGDRPPETELLLLKKMLLREFAREP